MEYNNNQLQYDEKKMRQKKVKYYNKPFQNVTSNKLCHAFANQNKRKHNNHNSHNHQNNHDSSNLLLVQHKHYN